jgi:hypothetical protein
LRASMGLLVSPLQYIGTTVVAVSALFAGCNALFGVTDLSFDGVSAGGVGGSAEGGAGAKGGVGGSGPGGGAVGGGGSGGAGGEYPELGPFGQIAPVDAINSSDDEDDPCFPADMAELYFNSERDSPGVANIFMSPRVDGDPMWGSPVAVAELNSSDDDSNPVIAPDGLTIWLASRRLSANYAIFVSTRASRSAKWDAPVIVPALTSPETDFPSAVSPDLLTLWLHSRREDGTDYDLYLSRRQSLGSPWDTPAPVAELNTTNSELGGWLRPDGLEVFFDRDGSGSGGELYHALRLDIQAPFLDVQALDELNTPFHDSDPWLSPDRRYIIFTRGPTPRDIYHAFR